MLLKRFHLKDKSERLRMLPFGLVQQLFQDLHLAVDDAGQGPRAGRLLAPVFTSPQAEPKPQLPGHVRA